MISKLIGVKEKGNVLRFFFRENVKERDILDSLVVGEKNVQEIPCTVRVKVILRGVRVTVFLVEKQ